MASAPDVPEVSTGADILESWGDAVARRLSRGCLLYATGTTQSVSTGVGSLTLVTFSAAQAVSDPDSWFVDANDSIKLPTAGVYYIWSYVKFTDDSAGQRRSAIRVGGTNIYEVFLPATGGVQPQGLCAHGYWNAAANDEVTVAAAQSSGGNLNIITKALAAYRLW